MPKTSFSVIITTHHRPQLLARAIRSVLSQGNQLEVIVASDEDSAETRRTAEGLLRPTDSFLSLPGIPGPSATRNAALQLAKGQWVCFLDDDDTFIPGYFDRLSMASLDSGMVFYGNYQKQYTTTGVPHNQFVDLSDQQPRRLLIKNFIPLHAALFPRAHIGLAAFDPSLSSHEDWDFLLQLYKRLPFRHIDTAGACYHLSDAASRNTLSNAAALEIYRQIYKRHPRLDPQLWKRRRRQLRRMRL